MNAPHPDAEQLTLAALPAELAVRAGVLLQRMRELQDLGARRRGELSRARAYAGA